MKKVVLGSWFLVLGSWFLVFGFSSKVLISKHQVLGSVDILGRGLSRNGGAVS